ncbi:MAG: U32 family peptidase [Oscillospiraceae bacterium]|nr:U32 family peptidase [Oscillospiraceae bacterium]
MLELVSPASSPEGVVAAVQNGADAVCLGFKELNSCMEAENFTFDEFGRALEYCRIRGVRAYLAQDSLVFDSELPIVAQNTKQANGYGVDAIIVQDLGAMRAVRQAVPDMPVFASSRMGIHNLEGVKMAAAMGAKRVTLAGELTHGEIGYICKRSPIEIEISVHGNLCMSSSGGCYMSAFLCENSDSRGICDKPCQKSYNSSGHIKAYPLSLKDNCLVRYLSDLEKIGVSAIKIDGRDKRPEYTALVTGMYSKAARTGKSPSRESMQTMQKTFSRQGFTDGYYTDQKDANMLGLREEDNRDDTALFASTRKLYLNGEFQRVPIRFVGSVEAGKPAKLAAADDKKNGAVAYGPIPEQAFHKELTTAMLQTELYKTHGTPFICMGVKGKIQPGLTLPMSAFSDMRLELFAQILEQRRPLTLRPEGDYSPTVYTSDEIVPDLHDMNRSEPPAINISVTRADQLSEQMLELSPALLYIPVTELDYESSILRKFAENENIATAVILPRVIHDNEKTRISKMLTRASSLGISDALISNIGHIQFAKSHGMSVRGDYGLNVFNSESLFVLQKLGLRSATISFELRLSDIRDLSKPLDTEIITYGRLPLMHTESCIVRNCAQACICDSFTGLTDEQGQIFPVAADFGCRNTLLHSKKLFMADKHKSILRLGIWAERLCFTTENAIECVAVLKRYMGTGSFSPQSFTRGLYFRGAENRL